MEEAFSTNIKIKRRDSFDAGRGEYVSPIGVVASTRNGLIHLSESGVIKKTQCGSSIDNGTVVLRVDSGSWS